MVHYITHQPAYREWVVWISLNQEAKKSTWAKPVNLKYPVNSTSDDFYFITRDGLSGYFSSNREGEKGMTIFIALTTLLLLLFKCSFF
jgi:hypothetical protein